MYSISSFSDKSFLYKTSFPTAAISTLPDLQREIRPLISFRLVDFLSLNQAPTNVFKPSFFAKIGILSFPYVHEKVLIHLVYGLTIFNFLKIC